jgi:hypothetical protein
MYRVKDNKNKILRGNIMHEKRIPLTDEEAKYKKKSTAKGQPRSNHKHIYETVLLTKDYHTTDYKTGKPKTNQTILPTKVCVICGRIDIVDNDQSFYIKKHISDLPCCAYETVLSEKALNLPRWYAKDFWDKFAIKNVDE